MKKVVLEKELLERLYFQEEKSLREIARETGHDFKTVLKLFEQNGLDRRSGVKAWEVRRKKISAKVTREQVTELYLKRRLSLVDTAKRLGVSKKFLRCEMRKLGIAAMTKSQAMVGKRKSEEHRLKILAVPRPTKDTSIERAVEEELAEREIGHYKHLPILGVCQSDKAFPDEKIAVFCDGDYWHSIPKAVEKDARVNKTLKEGGWTVLRFTEREIKADAKKVVDKIEFILNEKRCGNGCKAAQVEEECCVSRF